MYNPVQFLSDSSNEEFKILVGDSLSSLVSSNNDEKLCAKRIMDISTNLFFHCQSLLKGNVILFNLNSTDASLSTCEISVYGIPIGE